MSSGMLYILVDKNSVSSFENIHLNIIHLNKKKLSLLKKTSEVAYQKILKKVGFVTFLL